MAQGSIKDTTGYVNYVYNISARGTSQVATQLLGLSNITGSILGQLAFQTSSYLSSTEGALLSIGTIATAGLAKASQQAMEFDQAMSTVGAISGKTRDQVGDLGEEAMDMSAKFGVAVGEMTKGLESLARAGVSAGNMNAILEQAMGLSKLEGLSLDTAINDLISTTNLLDTQGLDLESPEYADAVAYQNQKITATSEAAPINAQDIIHTLEHIGGYASSTNLDQDDLYAVIAQLGSKGTKSEMAGTSLRAFISAGQKDTAQRALDRIGLKVSDLWKNDEQIMSITDMKDVLDEAMEAKGYTRQEKLEFYSDFAGYKQANQIMKIDTTSAREFKEKIDKSWDMGSKIAQVIGTAETNFQGMVQAGTNFLTKVGEPLLPIISTISWVTKNIIGLIDMIPGSHLLILSGGILVGIKAISTIFNKIGPQLLESVTSVGTLSDFFKDIRKNLDQSLTIIKAIGDEEAIKDIAFENDVTNITDKDRLEYYQAQGYDVKTPEEIIKIKSAADDEKIIEHKRARLEDIATSNQRKKEDNDHRVNQNRKKPKASFNYDKIVDPINEVNKTLTDIYSIIENFGDKTNKDVKSDSSPLHVAVDLSSIEQKISSIVSVLSSLHSFGYDIKSIYQTLSQDKIESKTEIDNNIISDLKRHTWNVRVVGPVATLTKKERDEKWGKEGWKMEDFLHYNVSKTAYASTGQVFGGHSRYSYHGKTYEDYHMSSDAQRRKGRQKQADARRKRAQRNKRNRNPQYGDSPTPDYDGDGSYGFDYETSDLDTVTSSFDVGVNKGNFRTAQGRLNRARRIYNSRHKDAKIKDENWQAYLTDLYLEDQNSPIIKEISEIMRKDTGDKAGQFLTDFFKQMTPIRTRGSMKLSGSDFAKLNIKRTGSNALDTVAGLIEQKFANHQDFMNSTGFSFRTNLDSDQIEKEFDDVISAIFKKFGEARLNLQETNPDELQDVTLVPNSYISTFSKSSVMILADAMDLLGEGNITQEKINSNKFKELVKPEFEQKADLLKGSLILGSLQQSPLMKSLKSLYKNSGYEQESSFISNIVAQAFNDAMKDHKDLQLSMRGLDVGKNGKLKGGNNKLENIVYSLAMESQITDDQDSLSAFMIDFMSNMQTYAGVSDEEMTSVINEAKDYDKKRREEAKKTIQNNVDLTENAKQGVYSISSKHRGYAGGVIADESGIGESWGEDDETYEWKDEQGNTHQSFVGAVASGELRDKDVDTSMSGLDLAYVVNQHGSQLEYIAQRINETDNDDEIKTLEDRLDQIFAPLSENDQNALAAAYGLRYNRRINREITDVSALNPTDEYYNTKYGRNTAFFNGVELGNLNDRRATFSQHLMFLSEDLDPLIKKASVLKHEMQLIADIKMLQDLGLLDEEFENDLDFLRDIHHLVADIHVKGKALQGRHRGYRGLGDQSTPQATVGVAIREQGNIAADKNVAKVLPDPDNPDRNYVKETLERRSLGTIARLTAPLYGRAGLPETGGMKLPLKHISNVVGFDEEGNPIEDSLSSIPWLMQRANSPVEVMYALSDSEYGDTGVWHKNAQGNYANIWTPEAMMKRLAATTMGSVIENLGALALYDNTTGEEGDEHIITSANVKNIAASKLTPQMLQVVDYMYEQQGFTSLTDLKLRAGDKYDAFVEEVHKRMDTAGPEEGFEPDEQANNQFKRWVNDDELARLEREGLLDVIKDDKGNAITRQKGKGKDAYTQHLVYDWEALRLSKEEIAQQYTVMMMANAMHAQELMTQKMAMSPSAFAEFSNEAYNLSSTILSDPRKFLSMSRGDLISYGVTDDKAFFSIGKTLEALNSADPEKITSLLRDVTVGDLGSEFVDKLSEMGYYADFDDETFQSTNVATIAESFGGTYELIVEILQDMFYQIEQMRDINAIFDPNKKIAQSVQGHTKDQLATDAAMRYNSDAESELKEIQNNIRENQANQGYVVYSGNAYGEFYKEHIESDTLSILDEEGNVIGTQYMPPIGRSNIPYDEQKFIPDMWQRSMAQEPEIVENFVSELWEELSDYLTAMLDMPESLKQAFQLGFDKNIVKFAESNSVAQQYMKSRGGLDIMTVKRELYKSLDLFDYDPENAEYIKTRIDQQNEELNRLSEPHKNYPKIKKQNRKPYLTPDLVVDINSSNNANVWEHNSRAFKNKKSLEEKLDVVGDTIVSKVSPGDIIGQGVLETIKEKDKKRKDKIKEKEKRENYITPYDALIIDDSYSDTELNMPDQPKFVGNDISFSQQKINAMNKKADQKMNEINAINERKRIKQFIKIAIRNIEMGNHDFAQSFLSVAKTHSDYDNLYKEAENELMEEREEEKYKNQLKALFPSSKNTDTEKLNLKNQAASLINQSVKETEELIEEMNEVEEIKDELRTIVTNFKEQFNVKVGNKKQSQSSQSSQNNLADMYGAQDYINMFGEKEGLSRSDVGYKDYISTYDNNVQEELIEERNKAAWIEFAKQNKSETLLLPPSQQYQKGKQKTQDIASYIKQQATNVSDKVANRMEQISLNNISEANNQLNTFGGYLTSSSESLKGVQSALEDFADIFPPLTIAILGLQTVIGFIEKATKINAGIQNIIQTGNELTNGSQFVKIFGQEIEAGSNAAKMLTGISGALSTAITTLTTIISNFLGPIILITTAIMGAKAALDWSYNSHKKYLQQLEDEEKENKSRSKSLQTITEQSKRTAEKNKAEKQQDALNRNYALNSERLRNANLTRTTGAVNLTRAQNDTLWGQYGIAAAFDKIQGKYESNVEDYEGSTSQIRRIKENTTGGQGLVRGMPGYYSPAQEQVAAYYDANQLALGRLDEYIDELGQLYDAETTAMLKYHTADVRGTPEFQRALDSFVEATGITREHAEQYLDYMQTEHNVDKATQSMQAQADAIAANTEFKIQAIAFGGNPSDVLGLNGIEAQQNAMVQAQADMIQLELSSQLWWKAVWSTITSPVRAILSPVFAITHILGAIWSFITGNWDTAGRHMQQAGSSLNVLGETATYWGAWGEVESTDFNSIGQGAIDERNRANYGNVGAGPKTGYMNATNPEDNSIFGIFPVGWPKSKQAHGVDEHKDQLSQNAQQSFFTKIISPITTVLGIIKGVTVSILTAIIATAIIKKTDLISKLPDFMQGPLGYMSGIGHAAYDAFVPESVKNVISLAQGFTETIGSRLYNGVKDKIPDSWKERYNSAKEWVKNKVGLGEDEKISEDDVAQAATESRDYLRMIWEWLTGNPPNGSGDNPPDNPPGGDSNVSSDTSPSDGSKRKRINIEDADEKRRSPLELLQLKRNKGLITQEEYNQELQKLTGGIYRIDPDETSTQLSEEDLRYYQAPTDEMLLNMSQHPEKNKKWFDLHQQMLEGQYSPIQNLLLNKLQSMTWTMDPYEPNGAMNGFGDLQLDALRVTSISLIGDFIHELTHRNFNHRQKIAKGEITATDDNYSYRASELEARLVEEKVLQGLGFNYENYNLREDIETAKLKGTWKEVNMDQVNELSKQMLQEKEILLGGLINIIQGSSREVVHSFGKEIFSIFGKDNINIDATKELQNITSDKKISREDFIKRYMTEEGGSQEEAEELYEEYSKLDYSKRPKNISQAVRMQTMMPSTVVMSGEEIAQMEKDDDIHKKALLRKHITENEKHFENIPKSQAVLAQILPFLGIEPEFDSEEFKIRNRGQKYGNRVTEGMSGEEIAQREKEQSKYYKKPQTYEEVLNGPRNRRTRQEEINREFSEIDSSNWYKNWKEISEAQEPKNKLARKGKEMQELSARYQAAGMLGQMMENPQATAYDTLNKINGVQICDQCGHKNPIDAKVCENCGARLDGKGRIGGAISNQTARLKDTILGRGDNENLTLGQKLSKLGGMSKRAQRKKKTNESAMDAGMSNMGLFGEMMSNPQEAATKARTQGLKICPECGHQNPSNALHCESCGARLDGRGRLGGFFADKMAIAKGKIKAKTTDKVKSKIDDTKGSLKSTIDGMTLDTEAKASGSLGNILEKIGNSKTYNKLAGLGSINLGLGGLTTGGFNPSAKIPGVNEGSWSGLDPNKKGGRRVRVPVQDANAPPQVKIPPIINPKTGEPYDLSHHGSQEGPKPTFINTGTEYAERRLNGEDRKDIALDMLTRDGEGFMGLNGEDGALNKVGSAGSKVGNFLQRKGGKLGKVGNIVSKGGNLLSGIGKKGVGNVAKGIGGKVVGGIGKKLATKGIAQIGSKVLGGALMATGIGAPLGLLLESPIGGMLIEGAMNLGGSLLGGLGKTVGRGVRGLGRALGFGRALPGEHGGIGGMALGGLGAIGGMAASAGGMLGGLATGAGNMIKGIFGGGSKNQAKASLKPHEVKAGQNAMQMGKSLKNIDKSSDITSQHNEKIAGKAAGILEQVKHNNTQSSNGGSITIQNININTADDPEAIKEIFLELLIDLQEQVNPRLVSRTAGQASNNSNNTETNTTDTNTTDTNTTDTNTNQNTNVTK